ncbi:MAG: hypothetical protein P1V18_03715 [Candidatus Gracilibacteria bacterium]|nr:hypothetical protein [Candidatus Gracilibacteria bacterium]
MYKKFVQYRRGVKGFTLIDVLIAVSLTSFLVILLTLFIGETIQYTTFITRHQQIRSESFAIVNNTLASLIREAVSIDYSQTNETTLVLNMNKQEDASARVKVEIATPSPPDDTRSQLQMSWGNQHIMLNSSRTYIDEFVVTVPKRVENVRSTLQADRARQPMVEVTVRSRHQFAAEGAKAENMTFFQNPQVSYTGVYTLRNYSFSSLRTL